MSNSSGDWAVEATHAERVVQLQATVKLLNEENERLRVLVAHIEPMDDPSNDLRGERYSLRFDVPSGKVTFRPGVDVGFWRFHQSGNPDVSYSRRTWAVHLGIAR